MLKIFRTTIAILIALSSFASVGIPTAGQVFGITTFIKSTISGLTIDIGETDDASFLTDYHVVKEGEGYLEESIWISVGQSQILVLISDKTTTPATWSSVTADDLSGVHPGQTFILGQETDADSGWLLVKAGDLPFDSEIMYTDFHMNVVETYSVSVHLVSHTSMVAEDISWIQDNLTIDGDPAYADIDLPALESMVAGTHPVEPVPITRTSETIEDWSDNGIVSDSEWISPNYGTQVTWNTTSLAFPVYYIDAVRFSSTSNYELTLTTRNTIGEVRIYETTEPEARTYQELEELWNTEEWLGERNLHFPTIGSKHDDDSTSAIFSSRWGYGQIGYVIREGVYVTDTTFVSITVLGTEDTIADAYTETMANLHINGELIEPSWTQAELDELIPTREGDSTQAADSDSPSGSPEEITRTSRTSSSQQTTQTGGDTLITEAGVTIDLGPSGEAVFYEEGHYVTESDTYSLESVTIDYGKTIVMIDVMEGAVDVDAYMATAESDIAVTYDYMDRLGGDTHADHAWAVYSGAYKLDYRELVYLELIHDPVTGLYFGIGVYGSEDTLAADIDWLQGNITIDGEGILGTADTDLIASIIDGSSDFTSEPVPMPETTVADWADAGLISETEWQSPFTSTSLTWDGENLVFPFAQPDALSVGDGVTTLELRTADRRGEVKISTAEIDSTPADWVDNWTSDDYLKAEEESGRQLAILDSWVSDETGSVIVMYHTELGHPVVGILDVYVNADGVTILTEIYAAPEDIARVYSMFWDSVQSNGDYYPLTWTIEDIESLAVD